MASEVSLKESSTEGSPKSSADDIRNLDLISDIKVSRSVSTGDLMRPEYSQAKGKGFKTLPSSKSLKSSPRKKFKWHDLSTGYTLTAGGILFYDDQGIWVIGEKDRSGIVYTDIGGRYTYEDGNIWVTISRELREETYGTCELFASEIVSLSKKHPPVYVNGHENRPVYMCLVIPIVELMLESRKNFVLDPIMFNKQRNITLAENPDVPADYYCPCVLTKLSYEELADPRFRLSYRLKRIMKFSTVFPRDIIRTPSGSEQCSDED